MGLKAAAFLWGLAEATLFFIVPDVLLSAVALRDRALALRLCLWALLGALMGGVVMYLFGARATEQTSEVLVMVPAINEAMVSRVGDELEQLGSLALFLGPLSGTPYKIYATLAPEADISLLAFLVVSVPARIIRFVLVALITSWVVQLVLRRWSYRARLTLLLSIWLLFYAVYFLVMPWR